MGILDGLMEVERTVGSFGISPAAKVVNVAFAQVGSHYLTGGYGATPGNRDGASGRPGEVDLEECLEPKGDKTLAIHAAGNHILGKNVCAGGNPYLTLTRTVDKADPGLKTYLDGLKGKAPESWDEFMYCYTPREVFVKGASKGLYWGETCKGQKHFDCIGFVNYCFDKAGVIPHCQNDIPLWLNVTVEVQDPQPGDLLIKYNGPHQHQHIGIVGNDGQIIQAADTFNGVHARSPVEKPGKFFTNLRRYRPWK